MATPKDASVTTPAGGGPVRVGAAQGLFPPMLSTQRQSLLTTERSNLARNGRKKRASGENCTTSPTDRLVSAKTNPAQNLSFHHLWPTNPASLSQPSTLTKRKAKTSLVNINR